MEMNRTRNGNRSELLEETERNRNRMEQNAIIFWIQASRTISSCIRELNKSSGIVLSRAAPRGRCNAFELPAHEVRMALLVYILPLGLVSLEAGTQIHFEGILKPLKALQWPFKGQFMAFQSGFQGFLIASSSPSGGFENTLKGMF